MDTKTVDPAIAQLTIRFKEKLSPMDTRVVTANVHRLNDEECASIIGGAAPPPRKPDADIIEGDDGPPPQPQLPQPIDTSGSGSPNRTLSSGIHLTSRLHPTPQTNPPYIGLFLCF